MTASASPNSKILIRQGKARGQKESYTLKQIKAALEEKKNAFKYQGVKHTYQYFLFYFLY